MLQRIILILCQTLVLSVVDYGLGLLILSKTQLERLEVIQNQGISTILSKHLELTLVDTSYTTFLLKERGIPLGSMRKCAFP